MKYLLHILSSLSITTCLHAQNFDTTFYSVVTNGNIVGAQKIWVNEPNHYNFIFYFNDRGRGSNIQESVQTNEEGQVKVVKGTGIDYFKNPYRESYNVIKDSAIWVINDQRKSKKFDNQFYSSSQIPAINSLLIKWLSYQPNKKGKYLPDNFVYTFEPEIKSISYKNKSETLKLFAIYSDSTPLPHYVWLTNELNFFADINGWSSVIKKGYENWCDTLLMLQENADQKYYSTQILRLSSALPANLLIINASLFESSTGTVKTNMSLEISGGEITRIFPSANQAMGTDSIIDAKGKFLMPGLWDMHSHYFKSAGDWYLAGGVTHVRDMGNTPIILYYKQLINSNELLGPDISYLSGFIDKKGPYQGPTGKIVSSLNEGLAAIRDYHKSGYGNIKIYSSINPEWIVPMANLAHKLNMRVCGHIPAFMTADQAIEAGYDEITHMNYAFLNFLEDTLDTRTPVRFRAVGDRSGNLDLQSIRVKEFLRKMKKRNISIDPTMNVFAELFNEFAGDTSEMYQPIISWMPNSEKETIRIENPFGSVDQKNKYKAAFKNMLKMLKLMYESGILIVPGTDGGNAIALQHELELYVLAGIPANEVLKIATYNAAKNCRMQDTFGEIKVGRQADLILIDGNPVKNISDVRKVEWVIKNSKMYNPKQLLASEGWKYYY